MKLLKSRKSVVDYEQMFHDSQQKLSWYIEALEQKQIQCDTMDNVVSMMKQENKNLKQELEALKKSLLDLPKLLGKNLGK